MSKFQYLPLCAGIIAAQLVSLPVLAQIEEVVVTARKQSESLQEVPIAITAFSSELMERSDFTNLEDVARGTVGLTYAGGSSSGYQGSPTIRGLRQGFTQDRVQNVAIFLDGVYLARQSMANMGMIDLERIEVVKGPQNALYGRNAFSGAINYVTKKPSEEFEAYVSTTQGTDGREDWKFSASGPLIEGKLLGRYSYGESYYDGHTQNDHPFAHVDVAAFSDGGSDEMLGGWEDGTYNVGLTWLAADNLQVDAGYYRTKLKREDQAAWVLNGVREVARFQTTPFGDMNSNPVRLQTLRGNSQGGVFISEGNTMWQGRLSTGRDHTGTWIGAVDAAGNPADNWGYGDGVVVADPRDPGIQADPRGFGFTANTDVVTLGVSWDIDDVWSLDYTLGYVDHEGIQTGNADRDTLLGTLMVDGSLTNNRIDPYIQSNASSSRPVIAQDSLSHELRISWSGSDDYSFAFGAYYSDTEDEAYDVTSYNPICTTDERLLDQDQDASIGCYLPYSSAPALDNTPLNQVEFLGIFDVFRGAWSGQKGTRSIFEEQVASVFAQFEYSFTPEVTGRIEGRYTEEDKSIRRLSDNFAIPAGGSYTPVTGQVAADIIYSTACAPGETTIGPNGDLCSPYEDQDNFYYFTPKVSIDWQVTEESMVYAYAANGLKAGGFNNTADPSQSSYEPEENWTFEVGSKNTLFDNMMLLNVAVYYVDWSDLIGGQTPNDAGLNPNAGSLQANIGDVENYGLEIEGTVFLNDNFSVNFGAAYTDPQYDDDVRYQEAKTNYYYQCTAENLTTDTNPDGTSIGGNFDDVIDWNERCGDDRIGGNSLPKVSKEQYTMALNYAQTYGEGWDLNARLDGSYQSEQWISPLNEGIIPSYTVYNASINLMAPEHWEFTLWGKNITDKKYISGAFTLGLFNKLIVNYGAESSYGATVKYNF